jgi:transcription elongation GreA/GreB family factor
LDNKNKETLGLILGKYVITTSKNRVSIYSPLGKILQGARKK